MIVCLTFSSMFKIIVDGVNNDDDDGGGGCGGSFEDDDEYDDHDDDDDDATAIRVSLINRAPK